MKSTDKYKTDSLFAVRFFCAYVLFTLSMLVHHMGMLRNPLFHFNIKPEAVNTQRDNRQEEPLDIVAEKLSARTIKHQTMTINRRVLGFPRMS